MTNNVVGQKKIIKQLSNYTLDNFPKTILFVGEKGCGKHHIASKIAANILKLTLLDITTTLSNNLIDDIYRSPLPQVYLIDLNNMQEKEQNVILKFIEEPPLSSFIIIICENTNFVLDTIINRCRVFNFENYSVDELRTFDVNKQFSDDTLRLLSTPGNVLNTVSNTISLNSMIELCDKITNRISNATLANTLSIKNKINFKDEYDKFDLNIFLKILANSMYNQFLATNRINIYEMYKTLENQRKIALNAKINKEIWFENLLIKLWKVSRQNERH